MNLLFKELNSKLDNLDELLTIKLRGSPEEDFDISNLELNQLPKIETDEFITATYVKSRRIRQNLEMTKAEYTSIISNQRTSPNRNSRQKISF